MLGEALQALPAERTNRTSSVEMSGIDSEKIHFQRNEAAMSEIASLIVGSE